MNTSSSISVIVTDSASFYISKYQSKKVITSYQTNGNVRTRELFRLGMAKRITEDWASLLLNEKTTITTEDDKASAWLMGEDSEQGTGGVLGDSNFWAEANELLEKAFAYGTGAFVARADGAKVSENGAVIPSAECRASIEYVDALSIIPLSVEKSRITEAAFYIRVYQTRKRLCIYRNAHEGQKRKLYHRK